VLSIICLLMYVLNLFKWHDNYALMGSLGPCWVVLFIVNTAITIAFLVGSIGVLKGSESAREMLSYAAAAGIVATLLSLGFSFSLHGNSHYAAALASTIAAKAGAAGKTMQAAQVQQIVGITVAFTFVTGLFVGFIQLVYCSLLYRHMSKDPAPYAADATPSEVGAWPPPPSNAS
jgi:uncharacterized membrane protein YoaK (UPF0700 family)